MLEERQIQVFVDYLPSSALFFRRGGNGGQLFVLLGLVGWWCQRPHEGTSHTAVQQQPAQDQEAASPAKLVKKILIKRSQGAEENGTACHCQPISDWTLLIEVFANHGQRWLQVEG